MPNEAKVKAALRADRIWVVWAFLGSDLAMAELRAKNPDHDLRDLIVPNKVVQALPDDVLEEICKRLHGDRQYPAEVCQPLCILHDLWRELMVKWEKPLALL